MKIVYNPVHKNKLQLLASSVADISDIQTTYLKLDGSNAPEQSITRAAGVITEWTTSGTTFTPTYTSGLMSSYTDGTTTWTLTRDVNNNITGVTIS